MADSAYKTDEQLRKENLVKMLDKADGSSNHRVGRFMFCSSSLPGFVFYVILAFAPNYALSLPSLLLLGLFIVLFALGSWQLLVACNKYNRALDILYKLEKEI